MATVSCVKTKDFEMDYCKFGHGERIFAIIPGLSVQSVMSAATVIEDSYKTISDQFTTYVFDRRKEVPEDYSIEDMARDTAKAMKELGLKDTYLFGASQGGMISMVIAMEYPELVKKLALGSTSSQIHPEQRKVIDKWISLAEAGDKEGLYQEFGKEIYPPAVYEQFKDYFSEVSKTVTDAELKKFIILAKSIPKFNVTDGLKKINCPVLALGVYEDSVLDADATMEIAQELDERPDFKLYMYIGYGHAAFDTAPDYKQRVLDFYLEGE
ncbi:alpha/beta fold hydrolase [Butyrivibrio sp. XPD2002]|uniref:alpha/beta fold hydrolase n=1 Tax=Butyrivibrio sp. XPD2002 TaxID=1280665 RepID=UPI00040CABAD|nr:alpha/beta hydrolase [Butyrivibrio sp. XPD2002]